MWHREEECADPAYTSEERAKVRQVDHAGRDIALLWIGLLLTRFLSSDVVGLAIFGLGMGLALFAFLDMMGL